MKKFLTLTLTALLLTPALSQADDAHHADAKATTKTAEAPKKANDNSAPSMMMENMKKMQDQMAKLHAAKDPKERDQLMQEHMQTMQETMKMMHDSKGMMSGTKRGGMHMDMMQAMMDQMMDHQKAMQDMVK